ncbi:NADAR family protein, partial [uncultured Campylobacter sp.]|uniref:NADAR family protein n=1 Tax=uncultured Campylobacter sp. TaxID=218934 RepID=UPI0026315E13
INSSEAHEFLFFYKPDGAADESCLGQWQSSPFAVDADEYACAEQFMMASKAQIFGDEQTRAQIMQSCDAKQMKALGRQVRGFDERLWGEVRYSVVLSGNYYKFTQNPAMMRFLLATGDKILVEASPLDKIWGIGLGQQSENASRPSAWRGQNLLGFALMEVRDELRRLYKNYDLIDKKFLRD